MVFVAFCAAQLDFSCLGLRRLQRQVAAGCRHCRNLGDSVIGRTRNTGTRACGAVDPEQRVNPNRGLIHSQCFVNVQ
jgi:hypothetical protein